MKKTITFFRLLPVMMLALLLMGSGVKAWGQTPYLMSGGDYSEQFTNIANTTNWPNNFNGTDCAEWKSVAINTTGTLGDGIKTTVSTASFAIGTSGGVQRGSSNIYMLSTSTNNSCAIDLLLNFTGRNAGVISFDLATVFNSTGDRSSKLKLFYSTNGTTFTEITGTNLPYTATNNVAGSASITNISLPSAFNNSASAILRFYEYSTNTGSGGSQPKISIDNIVVTSTAISCADPTTQASTVTFSNVVSDQMTVGWTRGGTPGDGVIVVAKASSTPDDPSDLTSYTANTAFGSGTQIGSTGSYVVYIGSGTSVNVTGLNASTTYYYIVYEKNCTGTSIKINTTSPAGGNQATTAACAVNPTITATVTANTITPNSASSGGTGLSSGENCLITARGVCWNTTGTPTTADSKTTDGSGTTDFTSSLTSLSAQTLYYVRAYATNGFGTAYGNAVTFRTLSTELTQHPGTFTASAASSSQINLTFSAASTITNAKGYIILRRTGGGGNPSTTGIVDGVAPGSLSLPTGTTLVTNIDITSTTNFSNTNLSDFTQYNYAIFAYNWDGTNPETYNYYTATSFKVVSATTLTKEVPLPYTQDFESTTTEWLLATTLTNKWAIGSAANNGGSKSLYISNDGGTTNAYTLSSSQSGTDAAVRVDLTGQTAASLSFDWKSNGEVYNGTPYDYGEVYINKGSGDVLISSTQEFVNTTNFANKRISLTPYVGGVVTLKFRWVNDNVDGTQPPFVVDNISITAGDVPTLTTTAINAITVNGASSGGNITADGGSSITARGVCYSTTAAPTILSSKTTDGTGAGTFVSTLTGLADNTTYYLRAYATNSTGTAYGDEVSFTTSSVSAPVASAATNISTTSFNANWDAVTNASGGYLLDVSTSPTFGTGTPATLTEGFETGMPATYNTGTYPLGSGSWSLVNGGKSTNTIYNHNASSGGCQLQGGTSASATSPSLNTVGTVTFWGIRGTNATSIIVQKIISGVTTDVQTITLSTTMTQYSVVVNDNSPAVQIRFLNGAQVAYIDDVSIGYTSVTPSFVTGYNAKLIAGQSTVTSAVNTNLSPNTTYYYRVRAVGSASTSANSNTITAFTAIAGTVNASTMPDCATCNVVVANGGTLTVNANKTYNKVTVNPGGKLTLANGKTLTAPLTIESNANGTGTYVDENTGAGLPGITANVNQYLTYRTWYMSSPVASASPTGMDRIKYFDETVAGNSWPAATTMTAGKGYLVVPTDDDDHISNILFTGTLNTGNLNIPLTRSAANTEKPGFNLIGNPYPSYLDWKLVAENASNAVIMPTKTMWYRTKVAKQTDPVTYEYKFWTVNGDGVGTPATASKNIPPMQAFWVRAAASGNLALTNNMRLHESVTTNQLKAPAAKSSELQLIRLQVNNGINTDETVLYVSDNAANGFDTYDAPKMSNDNIAIPEIYTTLDNQHIVINALKSLPLDTEIGLGFAAGDATSFSIRANEITNLPSDVKVILKDYANNGLETDLTDGVTAYNFAPATTTGNRFSIIFRSAGSTTALNTNTGNGISVYSLKKGINVTVNAELNEHATVRVFNAVGQQLVSQHLTNRSTTINGNFNPGVYVVKVSNGTTVTATQKIVIK